MNTTSFKNLQLNPLKRDQKIITKCMEMLMNRKLFKEKDFDKYCKEALESYDELTHLCSYESPNLSFKIKIINDKVSTLNKVGGLTQLLDANQNILKLIIVQDIQPKPFKEIIEYPNSEVFWIREMIIDPKNHIITPKHVPLSSEEKEQVFEEYNLKKIEIPKIDKTDFMTRYYNMKVGDLFEIHRISIASGEAVSYRIVSNCSWDKLFL